MQTRPRIFDEIDLHKLIADYLIANLMVKHTEKDTVTIQDYNFAINIMENHVMDLQLDLLDINLLNANLETWTDDQIKAFSRLFILFTDAATCLLWSKQEKDNKTEVDNDAPVTCMSLHLPKKNNRNYIAFNTINKTLLDCGYEHYINKTHLDYGYEKSPHNDDTIVLFKRIDTENNFFAVKEKERFNYRCAGTNSFVLFVAKHAATARCESNVMEQCESTRPR